MSYDDLDHSSKHPTVKLFLFIWMALLFCTWLTWFASTIDLGVFNPVVALVIATFKALLVILFFMEIKYSTKMTMTVVIAAFFWLSILLVLTMSDYISRAWNQHPLR